MQFCQPGDQIRTSHGEEPPTQASVLLLVILAFSNAPRLVVPALKLLSAESFCIAAVSSVLFSALIDRLIPRFLRSTLMMTAVTLSPSLRWLRISSTRSADTSEAFKYASMSPSRATTAPLASRDFTFPVTTEPFSWLRAKAPKGTTSHRLIPGGERRAP